MTPLLSRPMARRLARLVLAWLVLATAAAGASPLVRPASLQLVCSTAGAMILVVADAGDNGASDSAAGSGAAAHQLDCPLCLPMAAPPPSPPPGAWPASACPSHRAAPSIPAAHRAAAAAPLPARGPPARS